MKKLISLIGMLALIMIVASPIKSQIDVITVQISHFNDSTKEIHEQMDKILESTHKIHNKREFVDSLRKKAEKYWCREGYSVDVGGTYGDMNIYVMDVGKNGAKIMPTFNGERELSEKNNEITLEGLYYDYIITYVATGKMGQKPLNKALFFTVLKKPKKLPDGEKK